MDNFYFTYVQVIMIRHAQKSGVSYELAFRVVKLCFTGFNNFGLGKFASGGANLAVAEPIRLIK